MLLSTSNPVTGAEINHIQRQQAAGSWLSWLNRLLWWGMLAGSTGMVIFSVVLPVSNPTIYATPGLKHPAVAYLLGALTLATFYTHFRLMLQTLVMAVNSISREKRGSTWESLLLTGIDARQIIIGKWRAIIALTWRDYLCLGFIRIGVTIGIGTLVFTEPRLGFIPLLMIGNSPTILPRMLLAAGSIFTLTMLNGVFTAAAGVLGGFFTRDQTSSQTSGMATRMALVMTPVLLILIPVLYVILTIPSATASPALQDMMNIAMFTQIGLIDNGTFIAAGIANPLGDWLLRYAIAIVGVVLIEIFLTWFALRYACWLAKRQGAA